MRSLIAFAFLFGFCGCACLDQKIKTSDLELFRKTYPQVAKHYTFLHEANIDRYLQIFQVDAGSIGTAMDMVVNKYPTVPGLRELADHAKAGEAKRIKQLTLDVNELKRAALDGTLCEFEFKNEQGYEWGFLVLKQGTITNRVVWGEGELSK